MGKRSAVALLALVTGALLFNTTATAPLGALLVAVGTYLLLLPHLGGRQRRLPESHGPRGRM